MAAMLHLIRHAAHDHPDDMLCGRMPGVALSAIGLRQAACLGRRCAAMALAALVTSPQVRCRMTMAAIADGRDVAPTFSDQADEVDFGHWTGRRLPSLGADPAWQQWNDDRDAAAAPGGETMREVEQRVVAMLDRLLERHPDGEVAVVTHAEIVRAAALHILGLPMQAYWRLEVSPASLTSLSLWRGGGRLVCLNDRAHLAAHP